MADREPGRLRVPVVLDLDPLKRDAQGKLRQQANAIGAKTADEIIDGATKRFRTTKALIGADFASGAINVADLRRQTRVAMDAFDAEIMRGMEKAKAAGKLTTGELVKLGGSLKNAGAAGAGSFRTEMNQLATWVRGGFIGVMIGGFALMARQVAGIMSGMLKGVIDTVNRGGQVIESRESFNSLTASNGLNAGDVLAAGRAGARGTVTDLQLMQRLNLALDAELPVTAKQMGTLSAAARVLARTMGGDATQAYSQLISSIEKGQGRMLAQLGVVVKMQDALKAWERQTGESSKSLTQQQKNAIFLTAVVKDLDRQLVTLGADSISPRERLTQISTTLTNLANSSAAAIASSPPILRFLDLLGSGAENSAARVQKLADAVGAFADTVLSKGGGGGTVFTILKGLFGATQTGRLVNGAADIGEAAVGHVLNSDAFKNNVARRGLDNGEQTAIQQINAEKDLKVLEEQRVKLHNQLAMLRKQEGRDLDTENRLAKIYDATITHIALLKSATKPPPAGPTDEEIAEQKRIMKAATDALEDFRVKQLNDVQKQLEAINKLEKAAILTGNHTMDAAIAKEKAALTDDLKQLNAQKDVIARIASGDIPQFLKNLAARQKNALFTPQNVTHDDGPDLGIGITNVQNNLQTQLATLQLMKQTGEITEHQWKDKVKDAMKAAHLQLLALLKTFGDLGLIAPDVLKQIADQLDQTGEHAESSAEKVAKLTGEFIAVARGVMSVADAMGVLDDKERQALEGAINLAEGIGRIASGDIVGGAIEGIGALVQLGQAAFGESAIDKERKKLLEDNNAALEKMRLEIAGWRADSIQAREEAKAFLAAVRAGQGIDQAFTATNFDRVKLQAVADAYGIQVIDSKGKVNQKALEQLQQAILAEQANGGLTASADGSSRLSVNITELQANKLLDFQATAVDHLAAIRRAVTGSDSSAPVAAMPTASLTSAGASTISVNVDVSAGAGMSTGDARDVGSAIGRGLLDTMSDAQRGMGLKGPYRFEIVKRT